MAAPRKPAPAGDLLWSEKYRPRRLEGLAGNADAKERLSQVIETRDLPHLLFVGPRGSGKLTAARCVARAILQREFASNYLELYGKEPITSEERKEARRVSHVSRKRLGSAAGKRFRFPRFIQVRVKPFIEVTAIGRGSYKILTIYDFQALPNEQQGFRRLMELYGRNCRFILVVPTISGIIDPILSRTQSIFFQRPDLAAFSAHLIKVAEREDLQLAPPTLRALFHAVDGRIGYALDVLQIASARVAGVQGGEGARGGKGAPGTNNRVPLDADAIYHVIQELEPQAARGILEGIGQRTRTFKDVRKLYRKMASDEGLTRAEMFTRLAREVARTPLAPVVKARLFELIAREDYQSLYEMREEVHGNALLAKLNQVFRRLES